jgi:BON domain-containing protein
MCQCSRGANDANTAQIPDIGQTLLNQTGPSFATSIDGMARVSLVIAVIVGSSACGGSRPADAPFNPPVQTVVLSERPAAIGVPENPIDRSIRRDLNAAIAEDADLRQRPISFHVVNGDVSVTGTVRSEDQRKKFNDLAMNTAGVKSVANALRIAE